MINVSFLKSPHPILWGLVLVASPLVSAATVVATDDGSTYPNGGTGWPSNWVTQVSTATSDGSVIQYSQTAAAQDGRLIRNVGFDLGSLTAGQYLQVKYDVIIGSDISFFSSADDQLGATLRLGVDGSSGASADSTFIIRAYGNATGGAAQALAWGAYNGGKNNAGFNAGLFQNMGMLIAANTTYSFTIDVHADTLDYDISIFNGTTTVSLLDRGWRSTLDKTGSELVFLGRQSLITDNFEYGIDNISVSVIPEPGASTLSLLAIVGVLFARRRSRAA
jgi:hypothetical protein